MSAKSASFGQFLSLGQAYQVVIRNALAGRQHRGCSGPCLGGVDQRNSDRAWPANYTRRGALQQEIACLKAKHLWSPPDYRMADMLPMALSASSAADNQGRPQGEPRRSLDPIWFAVLSVELRRGERKVGAAKL